ncbi:MAG: TPM domain-containing protein [Bacteroidota bacterium]
MRPFARAQGDTLNDTAPSSRVHLARILLLALLAVALSGPVIAQRFDLPPAPTDLPIQDTAGLLSTSERQAIGRKLVAFDDSTTTQVAVAIVPTVGGADMNEYATELGRDWGVGDAERDNGVVLLVALNDREMYIATGFGAEGALPDVLAGRIIREVIAPRFRQGQFYAGLDEGTDAILSALRGEYTRDTRPTASSGDGTAEALGLVLVILIVFIALAVANRGRPGPPSSGSGGKRRRRRGGPGVVFIPTGGGSWGGGGGGFGGFGGGGFGGGGFGGFGGGGFGGGGAGGGW